jgi:hypothetical protein
VADDKASYNGKSLRDEGRKWIERIKTSLTGDKKTKKWRDDAYEADAVFTGMQDASNNTETNDSTFNILYANVETIVPAIINSPPVPDIRRRFDNEDEAARDVATMLERCTTIQVDDSRLQIELEGVASDSYRAGRGIIRMRFKSDITEMLKDDVKQKALDDAGIEDNEPGEAETIVENERITFEAVSWRDFAHGAAKRWEDVPWMAFRHSMPLDDVEGFQNTEMVASQKEDDEKDEESNSDLVVWEVWCKASRKVKFIAENTGKILQDIDDPLGLSKFFPIATPVQPIEIVGSLVPVCPYAVYRQLAKELDIISKRIVRLTEAGKVRGWYSGSASDLENVMQLDDNEFAPINDAEVWAQHGGLEKAIAVWPAERFLAALKELYAAREQTKQAIYEITGISDIVRGASKASETLGAQQIKSQWGSLRIQKAQRAMERAARDIFVMMAEIIPNVFEWSTLEEMTQVQLTPKPQDIMPIPAPDVSMLDEQQSVQAQQQFQKAQEDQRKKLAKFARIQEILSDWTASYYAINVESESTIRADLTRQKAEVSEFLNASAAYFQAVAPLVMEGQMPPNVAIEVYAANSRLFNLGRATEVAIDEMVELAREKAKEPPQPEPPNPDLVKAKADAEAKAADMELKRQAFDLKAKEAINKAAIDKLKAESELNAKSLQARSDQMQMQLDLILKKLDIDLKQLSIIEKKQDIAAPPQEAVS